MDWVLVGSVAAFFVLCGLCACGVNLSGPRGHL
jgi:hypothetical protein